MPKFMSLFLADSCCLRILLDPTLACANKQFDSLLALQWPNKTKIFGFILMFVLWNGRIDNFIYLLYIDLDPNR